TLEAIATEKAGIIKPKIPVVIGETQKETVTVFKGIAKKHQSDIYFADRDITTLLESDLKGNYQQKNIATVLKTIEIIRNSSFSISDENIKNGLLNVVKNTGLQGRWQIIQQQPKIICDTAHNKEGLSYTMKQLQEETYKQLHIVFGVVNDKDLNPILELLPTNATYYFCKPNIPRGLNAEELQSLFLENGFVGNSYSIVNEALKAAKVNANEDDLIYVGGSTFVVAEII